MTARYWMFRCPTHGLTIFGHYFLMTGLLAGGCLTCHGEEDCPACPPAGVPRHSELIADAEQAHVS